MSRRAVVAGLLVAVGLTAAPPATADILHLEGGGLIDTDHWWVEGDTLMYQSPAGTVGIPRGVVLRIERSEELAGGAGRTSDDASSKRKPAVSRASDGQEWQRLLESFAEAKAELEARNFESASARFLKVIGDAPELTAARVGYALSEMALGHDGLALSVVLDGLSRDPDHADLHEVLGDLRNRGERVEDAMRAWRKAFELKPSDRLREKITKAGRELHAGRDYAFSTSSHFNVRYDADVDRDLAIALMDYLEEQYWVLADRFQHAPRQAITVLLYPTQQFHEVTQAAENVGGIYDGKIRVPLGGLRRVDPRAEGLLSHELTHAILHSKTRGNCPRWLHEGLAQVSQGGSIGPAERKSIAALLAGGDPAEWESREFSYPAALSLTQYVEGLRGFYGIIDLLDLLGDGLDTDEALRRVFDTDYAGLCRRWARELVDGDGR